MEGNSTPEGRGIIPRSIEDIFYFIENDTTARSKYLVRASYLQIYNEVSASSDFQHLESAVSFCRLSFVTHCRFFALVSADNWSR